MTAEPRMREWSPAELADTLSVYAAHGEEPRPATSHVALQERAS